MRKLVFLLSASLLLASSAAAQSSRWADEGDATAKQMISLERRWAEADCDANGVEKELLADDFYGTRTTGARYSKEDEIKSVEAPTSYGCKLEDVKVHFFGDSMAVLYGGEHSFHKDKDGKEVARCLAWTDTWLKRNGKWQIVAAMDENVKCKL